MQREQCRFRQKSSSTLRNNEACGWFSQVVCGQCFEFPSVFWHCWLSDRRSVWLVMALATYSLLSGRKPNGRPAYLRGKTSVKWGGYIHRHCTVKIRKVRMGNNPIVGYCATPMIRLLEELSATLQWLTAGVQSASLYDNFRKLGNNIMTSLMTS